MKIRRSEERGLTDLGWLKSHHTFSFGDYYDSAHMGFNSLRVINDDVVAPGKGFGAHPHRNMEIVTIPLSGSLAHEDSAGNKGTIRRGMVQRMSAGRGITHSEVNASQSEPVHFLQVWIEPEEKGLVPSYEDFSFDWPQNSSKTLGSYRSKYEPKDTSRHGVAIHQNIEIILHNRPSGLINFNSQQKGARWIHLIHGELNLGRDSEISLTAGDSVSLEPTDTQNFSVPMGKSTDFLEFFFPPGD
jgi:redox-sensitive bicupin YhaK (pirin superfamily)